MNKQQGYGHGHGHGDVPAAAGHCSFHPREVVVGVCAHCLKDRLLLLLLVNDNSNNADHRRSRSRSRSRSSSISLPNKVFALGSSFLQRLDSRHHHHHHRDSDSDDSDSDDATASIDDSFISIKFEDNGKATWDDHHYSVQNNKTDAEAAAAGKPAAAAAPATARARARPSSTSTVVVAVEHVKRGPGATRWRKQVVGRLLQLARWRRSSSSAAAAAGLDGKKEMRSKQARSGRGGWIRSLTRRRAHGDRAW